MNRASHPSWTSVLVAEIDEHRRETSMSREAFAQCVVEAWRAMGAPHMGRPWKTDGDIFEAARVNGQRLFRWCDEVTKDNGLLPVNVLPAVLLALPEVRRVRVLNAQLRGFGLMVERTPEGECAAAINELLGADIKESSEAHQALLAVAADPSPANLERAERELVEEVGSASSALSYVRSLRRPTAH